MGYIYLIKCETDSQYKIGVSKSPQRRLKQIQTGNPSKVSLITTYQSEIAYKIEKVLQRRFSHLKKEGEWFDLSIKDETSFLNQCSTIESNIMLLKSHDNAFI